DAADNGLNAADNQRLIELEGEIDALQDELSPYRGFLEDRAGLVAERGRFQAVTDAFNELGRLRNEIDALQDELDALPEAPEEGADPDAVQREELQTQITELTNQLESAEVDATQARDTLLENNDIPSWNGYDPTDPNRLDRLDQVAWGNTLYAYIEGTLVGGRPGSANYWPQPMVSWSNETGGPLRPDQIRNLVEYILNYERDFTIADLRAVRQFSRVPVDGATAGDGGDAVIGTDNVTLIQQEISAGLEAGELSEGVAASGENLFVQYGCSGCHGDQPGTGPALPGTWSHAEENEGDRLTATGFEGDPTGYIIHSIAQPNAYIVEGYAAGQMPQSFTTDQMSYQELIDIVAYIRAQD
ncbi:MAG: c-type cytochrome, partial [Anaerolineales bacterium]